MFSVTLQCMRLKGEYIEKNQDLDSSDLCANDETTAHQFRGTLYAKRVLRRSSSYLNCVTIKTT